MLCATLLKRRRGDLCLFENLGIRVSGEVDHWSMKPGVNVGRGLDAIHLSLEHDIHQDEINAGFLDELNSFFARIHSPAHHIPCGL